MWMYLSKKFIDFMNNFMPIHGIKKVKVSQKKFPDFSVMIDFLLTKTDIFSRTCFNLIYLFLIYQSVSVDESLVWHRMNFQHRDLLSPLKSALSLLDIHGIRPWKKGVKQIFSE